MIRQNIDRILTSQLKLKHMIMKLLVVLGILAVVGLLTIVLAVKVMDSIYDTFD